MLGKPVDGQPCSAPPCRELCHLPRPLETRTHLSDESGGSLKPLILSSSASTSALCSSEWLLLPLLLFDRLRPPQPKSAKRSSSESESMAQAGASDRKGRGAQRSPRRDGGKRSALHSNRGGCQRRRPNKVLAESRRESFKGTTGRRGLVASQLPQGWISCSRGIQGAVTHKGATINGVAAASSRMGAARCVECATIIPSRLDAPP